MRHISTHLNKAASRKRMTERGELMKYFCGKLNAGRMRDGLAPISMGHMGKLLQGIPTKDLYYLKSVCDSARSFSKKFWWEVDPNKHQPEA